MSVANDSLTLMNNLTKEGKKMKITITYSLWQSGNLLSVGNKASSADDLLAVMAELNKLGKGFTYNIREVEVNK
jgi:hypothetical protein